MTSASRSKRAEGGVVQKLVREDFDGDLALEARVITLVYGGHAAAPDLSFDFVPAKGLRDHPSSPGVDRQPV